MAILFQARLKDVHRSKIDPDRYRRELDIVEAYLAEYRYSLSQREFDYIQEIFRSAS